MDYMTAREQKFLKKLFLSLSKNANVKNDHHLITTISNKLMNYQVMPLDEHELDYLKQVLSNKLEDVCDCRNEIEINFISDLLGKIESNRLFPKKNR